MSQTGNRYKGLKKSWLLLDSCSNVDIFKNKHLLQNIFKVKDQTLNLQTNGGVMKSSGVDEYPKTVNAAYTMMVNFLKSVETNYRRETRNRNFSNPPVSQVIIPPGSKNIEDIPALIPTAHVEI